MVRSDYHLAGRVWRVPSVCMVKVKGVVWLYDLMHLCMCVLLGCGKICHERCASLCSQDCFSKGGRGREREGGQGRGREGGRRGGSREGWRREGGRGGIEGVEEGGRDEERESREVVRTVMTLFPGAVHDQHSAISDKMHRMLVNHANRFEILQQAFNMSKEEHHIIKEAVETRILKMAENYNAEIEITGTFLCFVCVTTITNICHVTDDLYPTCLYCSSFCSRIAGPKEPL